jgi:hypothetical protein
MKRTLGPSRVTPGLCWLVPLFPPLLYNTDTNSNHSFYSPSPFSPSLFEYLWKVEVPDDGFTPFIKFTFIYARVGKHEEEELGLGDTPGCLLADDRGAHRPAKREFLPECITSTSLL